MVKKLCCLLVLTSLVACTPANPPQAIDAGDPLDLSEMSGLEILDESIT